MKFHYNFSFLKKDVKEVALIHSTIKLENSLLQVDVSEFPKKTFKSSSKLLISKTIKPGCRVSQLIHLNTIAATLPSSAWAAPITKIFTEINRDLGIRKIIIYVHYLLGTLRLSHRPAIDWGSTFCARKLESFSII